MLNIIENIAGNSEVFQRGNAYNYNLNACKSKNQLLLAPSLYCTIGGHYDQGIESWTNVFRKVYKVQLTKGIYLLPTQKAVCYRQTSIFKL